MERGAAMPTLRERSEDGHLLDHLEFARKRWRMIAAIFLGFVAVAGWMTRRLPPVYQSTTRVLVGAGLSGSLLSDRANAIESYFLERRSFETQLEVIRSEPVAERAALLLGRIGPDTPEEERRAWIATIKSAVSVNRVSDTRIVVLRASGASPRSARDLADAVARAYIEYSQDQQDGARRRSIAWLTEETSNLREELRASEERLVDYLSNEHIDPALEEELGSSLGASEALRAQIDAAVLELSELRQRYRDRHPKVIDAQSRLEGLHRRASEEQTRSASDHRKLIQYRILKRDADLDHEMYQVLLKKLKEADLSSGLGEPDMRILEAATTPGAPVAPNVWRNLGVAAVLGLCLALGLAWAIEAFDRTLGTPETVERALGLPTLAVVRRFPSSGAGPIPVAQSARGAESEAFRALRTNVRFSHVDKPRRIVLVTSTGPEEGKSTVLANLAVSLASSGRRTLVVDTDLRRPSLHRLFGLSDGRGLADVLAGDAEIEAALRTSHVPGLEVLPSGTRPPNPAELIESARLHELIASLRERYDYILLDSPPAGGLIDSSLLSALADGVIFVVEPRRFDQRIVRTAIRQLERAGARLYGVVLNKAPRGEEVGLYGYYQYGRDLGERDATPAEAG
jgi:capsular exopolysaccharide synthesis family protein